MTLPDKVYVGDVGTAVVLDSGVDLSAAVSLSIAARKPDGTSVLWSAVAAETTKVRHDIVAGELDQPGVWWVHAKIALPSGSWTGREVAIRVYQPYA